VPKAARRSATSRRSTAATSASTSACARSGRGLSASKPDDERRVRVGVAGGGRGTVETGIPVLDHLVGLLAQYAWLDVTLEVEPGTATAEAAAPGGAPCEAR